MPWRYDPGVSADPYVVWLSEIMLQQTTVAAVVPYFRKFITRWPTVSDLAAASLDELLTAWAGLGYYARARNLHRCAKVVAETLDGRFPSKEEALCELPGIGPYTAAAIAAIAFGRRAVVVDGNVERVMARLYEFDEPLPAAKATLRRLAGQMTPRDRAGDYAQAVMDLGATICTPKSPSCTDCPWLSQCRAAKAGTAATLPRRTAKKPTPTKHGTAFWIVRPDGAVLLRRRAPRGLLGGMIEVPSSTWSTAASADPFTEAPVSARRWTNIPGQVEHTFTHFHLILDVAAAAVSAKAAAGLREADLLWVLPRDMHRHALPSVMKKIVARARAHAGR